MQENILMILTLDEIKKITEGLKYGLLFMDENEGKFNEKEKDNLEDMLIKLLKAQYDCSKS
ncbi:hypothetical protein N4T77_16075 [Clostridium sp. CX1]|uniref:Uncharacterized protein n=1 Tax=Clostridium tanneri TaxID=3037988 RepID=A0ABU4JS43_9CLOT|nr:MULTISPECIES: hypothetical protein [unclassified Clostridium]MCT8978109.1 hypothetical protein [Clostridium sp. CX1]MDW8800960.1 hypothetical protein [Clostridium sp. A1-XYC3]